MHFAPQVREVGSSRTISFFTVTRGCLGDLHSGFTIVDHSSTNCRLPRDDADLRDAVAGGVAVRFQSTKRWRVEHANFALTMGADP